MFPPMSSTILSPPPPPNVVDNPCSFTFVREVPIYTSDFPHIPNIVYDDALAFSQMNLPSRAHFGLTILAKFFVSFS
jgi:hypothetical protein